MTLTYFLLSTGINLIAVALVYIRLVREIERRRKGESLLREIREDAEEIVREINQVTDRNVGLIEESVRRLTSKIEEADKRITLLGKTAEKEDRERATYTHLKRAVPEQQIPDFDAMRGLRKEPPPEEEKPLRVRVVEMSRNGFSSQVIAHKTGATVGEVELMIHLAGSGREEVQHDNRH